MRASVLFVALVGARAQTLRGSVDAVGTTVDYPTAGTNSLEAGGGGKCSYSYSSHDGAPVVTKASCTITSKDLDHGSEPQPVERQYVKKLAEHDGCGSGDDAGHILANRLGGFAVPTNLFPQDPHLNRGTWEQFERAIYACMTDGGAKKASLSWSFTYSSTKDQRPSKASYHASYDGGCDSTSSTFTNTCNKDLELPLAVTATA